MAAVLMSNPFTSKLSASNCEALEASLIKSGYPSYMITQVMARGGCASAPSPSPSDTVSTTTQSTPSSPSPQWSSVQTHASTPSTPIQSPPADPSRIGITVSTDKSSYFIGDTVTTLVDFYGTSGGQNIAVSVTDPTGNTIISNTIMTDTTGAASLQFKVPMYAKTGSYQVETKVPFNGNEFENSAVFYVQENTQANGQDKGSNAISNGETTK
jgi:hypothetical protein